jgi:hypothetical protein
MVVVIPAWTGKAKPNGRFTSGPAIVLYLALAKLLLHLLTVSWLSVNGEQAFSASVDSAPSGRGFSRHRGSIVRWLFWCREAAREIRSRAASIGLMSPPDYPSAWLRPRSARFRFARQGHCSSATTCRFSTSGWARDSARTQTGQTRIVNVIASLEKSHNSFRQAVGVGPLFMPRCDRIPVMLTC